MGTKSAITDRCLSDRCLSYWSTFLNATNLVSPLEQYNVQRWAKSLQDRSGETQPTDVAPRLRRNTPDTNLVQLSRRDKRGHERTPVPMTKAWAALVNIGGAGALCIGMRRV